MRRFLIAAVFAIAGPMANAADLFVVDISSGGQAAHLTFRASY